MTNAASDRPAVADRTVGDTGGNGRENRQTVHAYAPILDIGGGDAGADDETVGVFFDVRQFRNRGDIDQDARPHQAKVQHRAQ
jgi:hypothetical protein